MEPMNGEDQDYEDADDAEFGPERNAMVRRSAVDGLAITAHNAATAALTAKATADINARWMIAMHRPRTMEVVRERLLRECARPAFAAGALYSVPRGNSQVKGLTIRFAEAAMLAMGNLGCEAQTLYDGDGERVIRVTVTDYETNAAWSRDITIPKTKEVKQLKRGERAISERVNSYGDPVYRVEATDDDVAVKEAAAISKASRTGILRMVPGNLLAECKERIDQTTRNKAAQDPDGERRKIVDEFSKVGLNAKWLVDWLGHSVDDATPDEIADLRQLYRAIRDKEITPADAVAAKRGEPERGPGVAASAVRRRDRKSEPQPAQATTTTPAIDADEAAEIARREAKEGK